MNYRRALLLAELGSDPAPSVSALTRVASSVERVIIVARVPSLDPPNTGGEHNAKDPLGLEQWRKAVAELVGTVEVHCLPELATDTLVDLALGEDIDLLVAGARSRQSAALLTKVAKKLAISLLWPSKEERTHSIENVWCLALSPSERAAMRKFLHEHAEPSLRVTVLGPDTTVAGDLADVQDILGIHAQIEVRPMTLTLRAWLEVMTHERAGDLVVLTHIPTVLLVRHLLPSPVLLLPETSPAATPTLDFDVSDIIDLGCPLRARVETAALAPAEAIVLALVSEGRILATEITSAAGELQFVTDAAVTSLGAVRVLDDVAPDPLTALEHRLSIFRRGARPLVLFDPTLPDDKLKMLTSLLGTDNLVPLAVRLRPTHRVPVLRERLRSFGLPPLVLDARAVLDEGEALDVTDAMDRVRFHRVAERIGDAGFEVKALLHHNLEGLEAPRDRPDDSTAGNRIEIELDNVQARTWLLEAIAASRRTVHAQVYMAADDDIGQAIELALSAAAERGVIVRVLVDSIHGLHGSFGAENPLLARLATRPGVELRVVRPVSSIPTLGDLKRRDHRKLVVVDNAVALIGGRNLSHEYYTGFEEVSLTESSLWREVPWLDAGARVEGPAVADMARSFLGSWTAAGGTSFAVEEVPSLGCTTARVVVHHGLRDADTLEAYLDLIDSARSHLYAVTGFPCALEVQHALLRALRRGVRLRVMTGHLTPTHNGELFKGLWSPMRATATELVHSRLDPLIEEGGDVYLFAKQRVVGWEPSLGVVHPHVHAKLLSVDARRCVIGSANLDVTSSYWESELMLVVDDATVAAQLERELDATMAASTRVEREDPLWRERARRRRWMRRWPGMLEF